jgi:uncharacterized protein (TIGR02246 family)
VCEGKETREMVNMEAEKAAIERLMRETEAAENRKDVDGMLEGMADDAFLQLCGSPQIQGHDAFRKLYEEFFKVFVGTSITILGTEVSASGDMAWQYGTHVNELESPDGRIKQPGKWMGVLKSVDGKWKWAAISISEDG